MSARTYSRDLLLNVVVNSAAWPRSLRAGAWRAAGHSIAPDVLIGADCFIGDWTGLTLGAGVFVNYGCFFDLSDRIDVEEGCRIGHGVMLITSGHRIGARARRAGDNTSAPIRIGAGSWIGARATVLAGVTIGAGCIIAAGAVVTRDCEPDGVYAGVPATRKRELTDEDRYDLVADATQVR